MTSLRSGVRTIRNGKDMWLFLVVGFLLLARGHGESQAQNQGQGPGTVVTIERFLLRLGPRQPDFSLEKKVTVLWTIENIVREYFQTEYEEAFRGAGMTGLSVVTPDEESESYETVKFLGGAVTFDQRSRSLPNEEKIQKDVESALQPDIVLDRLVMYFPWLTEVSFVPLSLVNGGIGYGFPKDEPEKTETENQSSESPELPAEEGSIVDDENAAVAVQDNEANGVKVSEVKADNSDNATVGLASGVALGGAVILLLVFLLVKSRRRRMEFWREDRHESDSAESFDEVDLQKGKPVATNSRFYMEDEQEQSIRLPRIWGVVPSQRMEVGTSPGSSEFSHDGDSMQEILTCTSMDRRSIQNVESFEHQKRLVDTLKKEMMASNAEIYPYMQDTHLDNTEPCALSPTDLSAAALEDTTPTRPVPSWNAPSESSFTGSASGSGYDSPTSPLAVMMRSLSLSGSSRQKSPSSRRDRSPYEPDSVEL